LPQLLKPQERITQALILPLISIGLLCLAIYGCENLYKHEKYQRPEWLAGKLYTQLAAAENLTMFAECIRIIGYDTILDVSGSNTIFAPTDEAMEQYLSENQYTSVTDIPEPELEKLVKFHIIQNGWSCEQLQELNEDGWIDPDDPDSEPNAYKRQTILINPTEKYWTKRRGDSEEIVRDSSSSSRYKKVYTRSRKYIPLFFDRLFDIYNLSPEDYSFYFNRSYEPGNTYYAGAKIIQADIFAENGFIHIIDKVVKPMLNAREMLDRELPGESYRMILDMIYKDPDFESNRQMTSDQAEARAGGVFDTLYDLSFPKLPFDIHEELTGQDYSLFKHVYLYHNGIYVPTDDAFQAFLDEIVTSRSGYPHWPDFQSVPDPVKDIILRSFFTNNPVYQKDFQKGFNDFENNKIFINEADIIRKEFGSNSTFLGMSEAVVPRALSSVTGPVYLRPEYSTFMYALEYTGLRKDLSRHWRNFCFFPIPDRVLEEDSSLVIEWINVSQNDYKFKSWNRDEEAFVTLSSGQLRTMIRNQVGISVPSGSVNKEFIKTLGGAYIIWNSVENTVQGSRPSTIGYGGTEKIICHPVPLKEPADNGKVWSANSWFNHANTEMWLALWEYSEFFKLLEKSGLYDTRFYDLTFINRGSNYTVFVPSDQALINCRADTLSKKDLAAFLKYHFVKGNLIFTDNKLPSKAYVTTRKDETSTPFSTHFSSLNIRTAPNIIEILDTAGIAFCHIPEKDETTNIMVSTDGRLNAVIHEIDTVLIKQ